MQLLEVIKKVYVHIRLFVESFFSYILIKKTIKSIRFDKNNILQKTFRLGKFYVKGKVREREIEKKEYFC